MPATRRDSAISTNFVTALTALANGDTIFFEQWYGKYVAGLANGAIATPLLQVFPGCGSSFGDVGNPLIIDTDATGVIDWNGSGSQFYLQAGNTGLHHKVICRPTNGGHMFLNTGGATGNELLHVESGACTVAADYNLAEVHVSGGATLDVLGDATTVDTLTNVWLDDGATFTCRRSWTGKVYQGERVRFNTPLASVVGVDWDQSGGFGDYRGGNLSGTYTGRGGILDTLRTMTVAIGVQHPGLTLIARPGVVRTVTALTTVGSGPVSMPPGTIVP